MFPAFYLIPTIYMKASRVPTCGKCAFASLLTWVIPNAFSGAPKVNIKPQKLKTRPGENNVPRCLKKYQGPEIHLKTITSKPGTPRFPFSRSQVPRHLSKNIVKNKSRTSNNLQATIKNLVAWAKAWDQDLKICWLKRLESPNPLVGKHWKQQIPRLENKRTSTIMCLCDLNCVLKFKTH